MTSRQEAELRVVLGGRMIGELGLDRVPAREHREALVELLSDVAAQLRARYGVLGTRWWLQQSHGSLGDRSPVHVLANGNCDDARTVAALARIHTA